MSDTLRVQLQSSLGSFYTIERELGGGGMSRVFLARDETLRRNVVVKLLPPDMLAGVSAERFDREIALAAGLQHPHIVPVHAAGQMDGVPYYTMPFVDGASLRDRLSGGVMLPITECIGILRDVAKALAYAHERGIVHRDIKPDNVLLTGGSAVVTDFGIAKAISAARVAAPGGTLTQVGVSIGTPAYMAPEQAAADPATDHRADIYSFGCLAYEMIAGRPPFLAKSPQKLLAAQLSEMPQAIAELRPDVPAPLAQLVMKCLAKDADARPQRAVEIARLLETVTSGAGHDAMPMILAGGRGMLARALAMYVTAFVVVAVVARAAIVAVGLPDWVFPGALIVMALGLPVILFTAFVHRTARTLIGQTPTYTPGGTPSLTHGTMARLAMKASPYWSWRRAGIGGAAAVASFVILVGAYMLLRSLGIGPAGSLLAAGSLEQDDKLLVVDLPNPAGDSTLGPAVTEALRTALGESRSVSVVSQTTLHDVLRRMQRPIGTRIDLALAREISAREGIRGLVDGSLLGVGGRYVIALRLVAPQSGAELATFRATASDQSEILPTIDKLARQVRERIGESLRNVQRTQPLAEVTTPSLDALKKYVQAWTHIEKGDFDNSMKLLEEAIAIDTGFAMAYRKLGIEYGNRGLAERADVYMERAYEHRDRLSEVERHILLGSYFRGRDPAQAVAAYERVLEIQPNHDIARYNLASVYNVLHEFGKADSLLAGVLDSNDAPANLYRTVAGTYMGLGKLELAAAVADTFVRRFPNNTLPKGLLANVLWARGRYDSAALVNETFAAVARSHVDRAFVISKRAELARMHGRIVEAMRHTNEALEYRRLAGAKYAPLEAALSEAIDRAWFLGDSVGARRAIDAALTREPLETLSGPEAPYGALVRALVLVGRPDRAAAAAAQSARQTAHVPRSLAAGTDRHVQGQIALTAGRYAEAIAAFRESDRIGLAYAGAPLIAHAYDLAGDVDSAIVVYNRVLERKINSPAHRHVEALYTPGVHKRLGELHEARGDRERALRHYRAFIELWKNADPQLQPKVLDARLRVAKLTRGADSKP